MGRSPCCEKAHTNRGAWSPEEDRILQDYIRLHGHGSWSSLPKSSGLLRCGKSCRLRWMNYLRPDLKRGNFSEDEDELIIKLHSLLGNKWSLIAGRLSGRTDNEVKNYWNTHIKRKLLKRGLDPQTHRPLSGAGSEPKKRTTATEPATITPMSETSSFFRIINFGKDTPFNIGNNDSSGSSGMTTTAQEMKNGEKIDLELSIGLNRFRSHNASSTVCN